MGRFMANSEIQPKHQDLNRKIQGKNYPFKNIYGCVEGDMVYVNMEAVENLTKNMTTLKDIALIIDISGSMQNYYENGAIAAPTRFLKKLFGVQEKDYSNSEIGKFCTFLVDMLTQYDDDGIDLYFFSEGLVYNTNVSSANEVSTAIGEATKSYGAFHGTLPTDAFKEFCNQIKAKKRSGMVLFLTDGEMSDGGSALKQFYKTTLHNDFKTRDNFYCYAIEFGHSANGALDVLDGLFQPEQGPEDLFDVESADNLRRIAEVLGQVTGMSAIGSNVPIKISVDGGAKMDMVNTDLIEKGQQSVQGTLNKIMSIRTRTNKPFNLKLEVAGFDAMTIKVTPRGIETDLEIL